MFSLSSLSSVNCSFNKIVNAVSFYQFSIWFCMLKDIMQRLAKRTPPALSRSVQAATLVKIPVDQLSF
jgi:hypothetical protein